MAIKITARAAEGEYDLGASKFLGNPTIPGEWLDDFSEDTMFFCQIRLSDIAHLDKENKLPKTGYLYVFFDTEGGEYDLVPIVRYYEGEPDCVVDAFNDCVADFEHLTRDYLMEFSLCDDRETCTHLFGEPDDYNYEDAPPKLFLQFDPLDTDVGFLSHLDGFIYLFFGDDVRDFSKITIMEEYS